MVNAVNKIVVLFLTGGIVFSTSSPSVSRGIFENDSPVLFLPSVGGPPLPLGETVPDDTNILLAEVSNADTKTLVDDILFVRGECGKLPAEYRIDCLGDGFSWAASRVYAGGEYGSARAIISKAASRLNAIAQQNADNSKEEIVPSPPTGSRWVARRRYLPVKRAALAVANTAARTVIEEAATQLLRSAENSDRRKVHYAKIAGAVDSTKKILRSA